MSRIESDQNRFRQIVRGRVREELRRHFEIDKEMIVIGVLDALRKEGKVSAKVVSGAIKDLGVDPEKLDPLHI